MNRYPMNRWSESARLSAFGAAYFLAAGAFMSYWPVWLRNRGITDAEIGTLFMARQLVSVVAMLGMGFIAHKLGRLRALLFGLSARRRRDDGRLPDLLHFPGAAAGRLDLGHRLVADHGALRRRAGERGRRRGMVYGRRAPVGLGRVHRRHVDHRRRGRSLRPAACSISGSRASRCWCRSPSLLPKAEPREPGQARHAPFGLFDLFRNKPFVLFMIGAGFCQSSHAVLYSFGTLTWRGAGIDDVTISLLWGESVAVEILMMMASGWLLQRIGVCGLIGLGLGCGIVRWTGMAFTTELPLLVVLQALHAATFAACHLGAMAFIQRALPASGVALGQSIYYALGTGATQAVIYQFAGLLYARYGQHAFLGMTVISALGLVSIVLLARLWDGGLLVGNSPDLSGSAHEP